MGGPGTRGLRRGVAFAAVVALHVGLVAWTAGFRAPTSSSSTEFVSASIFLSAALPPLAPSHLPHRELPDETPLVAPVEPPTVLPPVMGFPLDADTAIDWAAEARRAAAGITGPQRFREFGRTPGAGSGQGPRRSAPPHQAGEQYRDELGEWIVWVSDRCYIVSDTPALGLPQVLARSIPSRPVCQSDAQARSDLFKDLPAYRKYHPQ